MLCLLGRKINEFKYVDWLMLHTHTHTQTAYITALDLTTLKLRSHYFEKMLRGKTD